MCGRNHALWVGFGATENAEPSKVLSSSRKSTGVKIRRVTIEARSPGASVRKQAGHFGMSIMQERARRLGGEITVGRSVGGKGTMVRLSFPAKKSRLGVAA